MKKRKKTIQPSTIKGLGKNKYSQSNIRPTPKSDQAKVGHYQYHLHPWLHPSFQAVSGQVERTKNTWSDGAFTFHQQRSLNALMTQKGNMRHLQRGPETPQAPIPPVGSDPRLRSSKGIVPLVSQPAQVPNSSGLHHQQHPTPKGNKPKSRYLRL